MKKIVKILALAGVAAVIAVSLFADQKGWERLTDEAIDNYQAGRHDEAIRIARLALAEGERTFGPEDLKIVGSLDNLATYLARIDKYDEADKLYRRALSILEAKLPSDDRYLAIFMDYLAVFYEKTGSVEYANELRARAKAIRFKKRE